MLPMITVITEDPAFTYMPWIAHERITVDYLPGKVGRVHGHALSRETSVKGVQEERKRRSGDRRRRKETSKGTIGGGNKEGLVLTVGMVMKKLHHGIKVCHPVQKKQAQNLIS